MTKEKLIGLIKDLLEVDIELDFLLKLSEQELKVLTACIRSRLDEERDNGSIH